VHFSLIFLTPLFFGVAHVHHLYEFMLTHPYTPLLPVLIRTLFQLTYTAIFGAFATFLYLRTGSLPAAILTHAFCNCMGLPRVWGRVGKDIIVVEAGVSLGPHDVHDGSQNAGARVHEKSYENNGVRRQAGPSQRQTWEASVPYQQFTHMGTSWTLLYYMLLVSGAVGFWKLLWPLTESSAALVHF
jgi:prenyl protein peptidase